MRRESPELNQLRAELKRETYRQSYKRVLRSTVFTLVVAAAVAVLVAMLWMPVLRIYGTSMTPTLDEDEIVISIKGTEFETGDLVAFYFGNKLLIKRCIAGPGEWVNIDEMGNVYVNDRLLDEPYLEAKDAGDCDVKFPFQVPENRYFLLGDHRSVSLDSRNSAIGCVAEEQVAGKIIYRVWPLEKFGPLG